MIPKAPQRGFPVTADWGRSIVDALRRMRLRAGPGVKITQTPEGTTVSCPASDRLAEDGIDWPQWQCDIVPLASGDPALKVAPGRVAWGGGHSATWGGERFLLNFGGSARYVMWYTKAAPIAYEVCFEEPPDGPVCRDVEAREPAAFIPDVGQVGLFETPRRQDGWTDAHVLAIVKRSEEGEYSVEQLQVAELAVHAVVYPGEEPEEPTPEGEAEEEECDPWSNDAMEDFPSSVDDMDVPWGSYDSEDLEGGGGEQASFPSKIAACW